MAVSIKRLWTILGLLVGIDLLLAPFLDWVGIPGIRPLIERLHADYEISLFIITVWAVSFF